MGACGGHAAAVSSRALVREFAAVTDSIAFLSETACCRADVMVLRPHGRWTLLRVDAVERDFDAPADSGAYRAVARRLIGLGAAAGWGPQFGFVGSDMPLATVTIHAPGQCHQTTAGRSSDTGLPGDSVPAEWLAALRLLDSIIVHVAWRADGIRPLPTVASAAPRARWLCRWTETR